MKKFPLYIYFFVFFAGTLSAFAASGPRPLPPNWKLTPEKSLRTDGQILLTEQSPVQLSKIPVVADRCYRLNFTICGNPAVPDNTTGRLAFRAEILGENGWPIALPRQDTLSMGKPVDVSMKFQAGGSRVTLKVTAKKAAQFLLRDFRLEKISSVSSATAIIEISSPFYRNSFYHSDPVVRRVQGNINIPSEAARVEISFPRNEPLIRYLQPQSARQLRFDFDAAQLPDGDYPLKAEFFNRDGKKIEDHTEIIHCVPPGAHEIIVNRRKKILIDGRPFFPVLWFENSGRDYYFMAKIGVNLILANSQGNALKTLDLAQQFGLKVIFYNHALEHLSSDLGDDEQRWQKQFREFYTQELRTHPAFFGYYLIDEPGPQGYPPRLMRKSYDFYRKFDPYHPVWSNSAPLGSIPEQQEYAENCDIYGVDIYPIPLPAGHSGLKNKSLSCVGEYAARCNLIAGGKKTIWMVLQGFSWGDLRKDMPKTYPTDHQMRYMVYDSIVNGADGIAWWGNVYIQNKQYYDILVKYNEQMRTISGLLADGERLPLIRNNAITVLPIRLGNRFWYIAVNRQNAGARLNIDCPAKTIGVVGENREVTIRDGRLQDDFKAYDVHIYGPELPPPAYSAPVPVPELDRKQPSWADKTCDPATSAPPESY